MGNSFFSWKCQDGQRQKRSALWKHGLCCAPTHFSDGTNEPILQEAPGRNGRLVMLQNLHMQIPVHHSLDFQYWKSRVVIAMTPPQISRFQIVH